MVVLDCACHLGYMSDTYNLATLLQISYIPVRLVNFTSRSMFNFYYL